MSRYRVTARPAVIHLTGALSHELEREGASTLQAVQGSADHAGWDILGVGGESMVIVVRAPDSAAVHRALAKVPLPRTTQVDVTQLD